MEVHLWVHLGSTTNSSGFFKRIHGLAPWFSLYKVNMVWYIIIFDVYYYLE